MNSTAQRSDQDYRDNASGGDYPYYLDKGGNLSRSEWEAAAAPLEPDTYAGERVPFDGNYG